jgi:hypothetical protein
MKRKCSRCGVDNLNDEAILCSSCGFGLPNVPSDLQTITHEQEVKISEKVASILEGRKDFKKQIINGLINRAFVVIGIALVFIGGSYVEGIRIVNNKVNERLAELDIDTSNKIASVQYSIDTNITAQFQEPEIRQTVSSVAANQASNLLVQQIIPQIELFRTNTGNTMTGFSNALASFEAVSSNSLVELKLSMKLNSLIAKANSDDFNAFSQLVNIAENNDTPLEQREIAYKTTTAIQSREYVASLPNPLVTFFWDKAGLDKDKSSIEDMEKDFNVNSNGVYNQTAILDAIYGVQRFSKYERLDFIMKVLQTSPSIAVRAKALNIVQNESKDLHGIMALNYQIDWWNANKDKYTNGVSAK